MTTAPLPDDSLGQNPVRRAAAARLSLYLRELRRLQRLGVIGISSRELGEALGVTDAVVRRDLASLGQLGRRGVGYSVVGLMEQIRQLMGIERPWHVLLVGAGSLGTALLRHRGFSEQGFRVVAAVDVDPSQTGRQVGTVTIHPLHELEELITEHQVTLAILTVPAEAAAAIAQRLADAGVSGILNFAPVTIKVTGDVCIANVDLAGELQQLAFLVARSLDP